MDSYFIQGVIIIYFGAKIFSDLAGGRHLGGFSVPLTGPRESLGASFLSGSADIPGLSCTWPVPALGSAPSSFW